MAEMRDGEEDAAVWGGTTRILGLLLLSLVKRFDQVMRIFHSSGSEKLVLGAVLNQQW